MTITATGANLTTSVSVYVTGVSYLTWAGTITDGQALVIDCGARTVKNNGVDAYSGLTLHSTNHVIDDWLRLEPGNNSVLVAYTGGNGTSTALFNFNDLWE